MERSARAAGYSGTPLPRKLGIKPGSVVALLDAPKDFAQTLGELPPGVRLRRGVRGEPDLVLWFVRTQGALEKDLRRVASLPWTSGLWIAWAKQTSRLAGDVTETTIRDAALETGLVDYKVCAIDADWSGLKFARRKVT